VIQASGPGHMKRYGAPLYKIQSLPDGTMFNLVYVGVSLVLRELSLPAIFQESLRESSRNPAMLMCLLEASAPVRFH
jgi:hypothetical protein